MREVGTTALVALLPAAEVLSAAIDPALVRAELPAHVTIRYPFVPLSDAVAEVVAQQPAVTVELATLVEERGFVGLAVPELEPVRAATLRRWPEPLPYGGRFGPAPPLHLTVAMGASADDAARVREAVRELLPIRDRVVELQLVELTSGGWRPQARFPLRCSRPG
ncbi:MAG TPA: 2'-5' RNA ligase family protein [Mycobacteriales bacterium]|nr:2'-5' RNA ligase family protein [Mycobacteriales bacterium]